MCHEGQQSTTEDNRVDGDGPSQVSDKETALQRNRGQLSSNSNKNVNDAMHFSYSYKYNTNSAEDSDVI